MAKNNASKKATPANKDATTVRRHEARIDLLQDTANDVCDRIHDGERSFRVRAVRARSVDLRVKLAALNLMRAAIDDAEAAIKAAAGGDESERTARVNLRELPDE